MVKRPDLPTDFDHENTNFSNASTEEVKNEIYPQFSDRFKAAILWFGVIFLIAMVWMQNYSGYN